MSTFTEEEIFNFLKNNEQENINNVLEKFSLENNIKILKRSVFLKEDKSFDVIFNYLLDKHIDELEIIKDNLLITCSINNNHYAFKNIFEKIIDNKISFVSDFILDSAIKNNSKDILDLLINFSPKLKSKVVKTCIFYNNEEILKSLDNETINLNLDEKIFYSIFNKKEALINHLNYKINSNTNDKILQSIIDCKNFDLFLKIKSDNCLDNNLLLSRNLIKKYFAKDNIEAQVDFVHKILPYLDIKKMNLKEETSLQNLLYIQYPDFDKILLNLDEKTDYIRNNQDNIINSIVSKENVNFLNKMLLVLEKKGSNIIGELKNKLKNNKKPYEIDMYQLLDKSVYCNYFKYVEILCPMMELEQLNQIYNEYKNEKNLDIVSNFIQKIILEKEINSEININDKTVRSKRKI